MLSSRSPPPQGQAFTEQLAEPLRFAEAGTRAASVLSSRPAEMALNILESLVGGSGWWPELGGAVTPRASDGAEVVNAIDVK